MSINDWKGNNSISLAEIPQHYLLSSQDPRHNKTQGCTEPMSPSHMHETSCISYNLSRGVSAMWAHATQIIKLEQDKGGLGSG